MIFTSKIKKIGTGYWILIPAGIRNELHIGENDIVVNNIRRGKDNSIKRYFCIACEHIFDTDDEYPECPVCENSNLEVLEE